jgi:hypothetical protein
MAMASKQSGDGSSGKGSGDEGCATTSEPSCGSCGSLTKPPSTSELQQSETQTRTRRFSFESFEELVVEVRNSLYNLLWPDENATTDASIELPDDDEFVGFGREGEV